MKRFNIVALVAFFVALVLLFAMGPRNTRRMQSTLLGMVAPFLKTGSSLEKRYRDFREGLKSLDELQRENAELIVERKRLRTENETLRIFEQENNSLRAALQYRQRSVFKLIPARIVARDSSTWWRTVTIDRGSADGIEIDMPVLTESGLVGKTTAVSANASIVLLISDENCKVAAMVEGTREQGVVRGGRTSSASMPEINLSFLSKFANLQPGQKVYTSGVGGVYPPGVLIGTIHQFKARELDSLATLDPAVDLTTIEDMFVVTGRK
jgi:rod shape-determining protein MreC